MADPTGRVDTFHLGTFSQAPPLHQIYPHMCFAFNVPDPTLYPSILERLRRGLSQLARDLPWVGGHVINEGAKPGNTGIFKIKSYKDRRPELVVTDVRNDPTAPSMSDLRAAQFPLSKLKEEMLGPSRWVLTTGTIADDHPVIAVQACLIEGGLLFGFIGEHAVLDGMGIGQLVNLFAKACRGEAFSSKEMAHGGVCSIGISRTPGEEFVLEPHMNPLIVASNNNGPGPGPGPAEDGEQPPPPPPRCSWVNFGFNKESLAAMKSLAASTMTADVDYVSTDDAITAFIWQCVTRCRLSRMHKQGHVAETTTTTTLERAVDARRYLGVPEEYPGFCFAGRYMTWSARQLAEVEPIGRIASKLRVDVDPATSNFGPYVRALAASVEELVDKSCVTLLKNLLSSPVSIDVISWLKLTCQNQDFGPGLGRPEALRIPDFLPAEGLVFLLPETAQNGGGVVAAMCLRSEDIERLRQDAAWTAYATYIG